MKAAKLHIPAPSGSERSFLMRCCGPSYPAEMPKAFMTAVLGKRGQGEGEIWVPRLQPTFQIAVSTSMSL